MDAEELKRGMYEEAANATDRFMKEAGLDVALAAFPEAIQTWRIRITSLYLDAAAFGFEKGVHAGAETGIELAVQKIREIMTSGSSDG